MANTILRLIMARSASLWVLGILCSPLPSRHVSSLPASSFCSLKCFSPLPPCPWLFFPIVWDPTQPFPSDPISFPLPLFHSPKPTKPEGELGTVLSPFSPQTTLVVWPLLCRRRNVGSQSWMWPWLSRLCCTLDPACCLDPQDRSRLSNNKAITQQCCTRTELASFTSVADSWQPTRSIESLR